MELRRLGLSGMQRRFCRALESTGSAKHKPVQWCQGQRRAVAATASKGSPEPPGGQVDQSAIARHAEAQKRLLETSAQAMTVLYCRDESTWSFWRQLRRCNIDCSFDFRRWKRHQRASRNLQLWDPRNIWRADNVRRLAFPDMFVLGGFASLVSWYNSSVLASQPEKVATSVKHGLTTIMHPEMLSVPMECLTITSVALGLLITFHTRICYERFDDARGQWGLIINESRGFASRVLARMPTFKGMDEERVLKERRCAVKLIQSFPHTLKYHLTEDGCNPHINIYKDTSDAEVKAKTTAALRAELQLIWDMSDKREAALVDQLLASDAGNRPLLVLHELGHINSDIFADPKRGALDPIYSSEMDRSITLFQHILGRCERILRTPVYTPYTKFNSRFLYVWCATLPLAMFPILGPICTPPITVVVSFFLLGIQDMGCRVEQPFECLPLWQYCQTVDVSCDQLRRHSERDAELYEHHEDDYDEFANHSLVSYADPL